MAVLIYYFLQNTLQVKYNVVQNSLVIKKYHFTPDSDLFNIHVHACTSIIICNCHCAFYSFSCNQLPLSLTFIYLRKTKTETGFLSVQKVTCVSLVFSNEWEWLQSMDISIRNPRFSLKLGRWWVQAPTG